MVQFVETPDQEGKGIQMVKKSKDAPSLLMDVEASALLITKEVLVGVSEQGEQFMHFIINDKHSVLCVQHTWKENCCLIHWVFIGSIYLRGQVWPVGRH